MSRLVPLVAFGTTVFSSAVTSEINGFAPAGLPSVTNVAILGGKTKKVDFF
jgi:hypothetical protein